MYCWKIFKFSRLLTPSAWKNQDWRDIFTYFFCGLCGVSIVVFSNDVNYPANEPNFMFIGNLIWICALFSIIAETFWSVCGPTKRYKLNNGNTRLFVYKSQTLHKHDLFELVVHTKDASFTKYAEEYNVPYVDKSANCFTFRAAEDNNSDWISCNVQTGQIEVLGNRLNKILFISSEKDGRLNILMIDGSVKNLEYDYIVYNSCYIPNGAKLQIPQDVNSSFKSFPDEFLFIKHGNAYKTYSFFLKDNYIGYSEVFISSVIFREGKDRVLLEFDGEKYTECFRAGELSRRLNDYFLELIDDYRVGGKVYHYDAKKKSLDIIYEGNFRSIEFDNGEILGDDGKIYGKDYSS